MHFAATLLSALALAGAVAAQIEAGFITNKVYITVYENPEGQGNFATLEMDPQACVDVPGTLANSASSLIKPRNPRVSCDVFRKAGCEDLAFNYPESRGMDSDITTFNNEFRSVRCFTLSAVRN